MTRSIRILMALTVVSAISACGVTAPSAAKARTASNVAARATADEPAVIRQAALDAHAALLEADAAYKALSLNTASGRKLTEKREPVVRDGLKPVVARLADVCQAISLRLEAAQSTVKLATLSDQFDARVPRNEEAIPADASANAMLYRVAQYRLKLSFLVEYALRRGLVKDLVNAPTPGPQEDPGAGM